MLPKVLNPFCPVKFKITLVFIVIGLTLLSCKNGIGPTICTTEFVTISLQVQNSEGEAVEGVDITLRVSESGEETTICESQECNTGIEGNYQIFNDGLMDQTDESGETFIVNGQKGDLSFTESFAFAHDECHVFKMSGPDTVTIE